MSDTPIACTLQGTSYDDRIAEIRALLSRALKSSRRDGARLHLTFDPTARTEVEEMVRKERACCAFLDFSLSERSGAIELAITVPRAAADSADEILAVFAPSNG